MTAPLFVRQLFDLESSTYTYLIADRSAGVAALIDPVAEQLERDLGLVAELGLRLTHVLDTHVHADHLTAAGALRARTGARTHASAAGAPCVDVALVDGDVIQLGAVALIAMATPGHTDDGLTFAVPGAVFTGDTLLVRSCGRADFQNGDAGALYDSITTRLFTLPDDTLVYPGHDYQGRTVTTIGEEKRWNPRLAGKDKAAFVAIMGQLDLPPPRKLAIAVPANRACGGVVTAFTGGTPRAGYRDVTPASTLAARGTTRIVDVREPDEFGGELGHIDGAELVPLATVMTAAEDWDRSAEVILVCRSGNRSGRAAAALAAAGFERVMNMAGGMIAYGAAGLPIAR